MAAFAFQDRKRKKVVKEVEPDLMSVYLNLLTEYMKKGFSARIEHYLKMVPKISR